MRIRKNNATKISALLYAATSSLKPPAGWVNNNQQSIISHVVVTTNCELNQSPWDVMTTFSPPSSPPPQPPPQVNKTTGDTTEIDHSSMGSISASDQSIRGEEFNDFGETRRWDYHHDESVAGKAAEEEGLISSILVMCCKTDGKSWQCRKKAVPGNSMCQHHLSQTRTYTKKPAEEAQHRPRRPKKTSGSSTSSNPYEFYYYSGFGPRWGKKRGGVGDDGTNGCELAKKLEHDKMEPSPSSQIIYDDNSNHVEYEDDEFEDEEAEEINGKKRARKPIKARSLKSLM